MFDQVEEKRKEAKRREKYKERERKIEEMKMCSDVQRREMKEIECILHFYHFNLYINKNINVISHKKSKLFKDQGFR